RKAQQEEMLASTKIGAEVMLQSGIFGTIEDIDEDEQRVTLRSASSSLVVHRSAILNVITPVEEEESAPTSIAPDDDPNFGTHLSENDAPSDDSDSGSTDESNGKNT